jgi:hypothetical protein
MAPNDHYDPRVRGTVRVHSAAACASSYRACTVQTMPDAATESDPRQ